MEDKYAEIEIAGNNANEETGLKMSVGSQQAESENAKNRNDNEEFENSHEGEFEVEIVKEDSKSKKNMSVKSFGKGFLQNINLSLIRRFIKMRSHKNAKLVAKDKHLIYHLVLVSNLLGQ